MLRFSLVCAFFLTSLATTRSARAQEAPPPPPENSGPVPAADEATRKDTACHADWKKRAYFAARDSVVQIEPIGFTWDAFYPLSGFVYSTRSHVVALSDAIGVGRGVRVIFASGKVIRARAVSVDHVNRLSVLALESEAPSPPLEVTDRPMEVGSEVASVAPFEGRAVGDPDEAAIDAALQVGHVANAGDRTVFRFDGAFAPSRGTPVFACDGKLIALRDQNTMIPGSRLRALTAGDRPIPDGDWSLAHFHFGVLVQGDSDRAYVGAGTGLSLVYADRFQLRLGLGVLGGIPKRSERDNDLEKSVGRLQLESTIGYRFLLSEKWPVYLVPQVGVVGRVDITTQTQKLYSVSGACMSADGSCPVDLQTRRSTDTSWSVAPVAGVSLLGVAGGLSYQLQLDVKDPSRSTHQLFFGLEF